MSNKARRRLALKKLNAKKYNKMISIGGFTYTNPQISNPNTQIQQDIDDLKTKLEQTNLELAEAKQELQEAMNQQTKSDDEKREMLEKIQNTAIENERLKNEMSNLILNASVPIPVPQTLQTNNLTTSAIPIFVPPPPPITQAFPTSSNGNGRNISKSTRLLKGNKRGRKLEFINFKTMKVLNNIFKRDENLTALKKNRFKYNREHIKIGINEIKKHRLERKMKKKVKNVKKIKK